MRCRVASAVGLSAAKRLRQCSADSGCLAASRTAAHARRASSLRPSQRCVVGWLVARRDHVEPRGMSLFCPWLGDWTGQPTGSLGYSSRLRVRPDSVSEASAALSAFEGMQSNSSEASPGPVPPCPGSSRLPPPNWLEAHLTISRPSLRPGFGLRWVSRPGSVPTLRFAIEIGCRAAVSVDFRARFGFCCSGGGLPRQPLSPSASSISLD